MYLETECSQATFILFLDLFTHFLKKQPVFGLNLIFSWSIPDSIWNIFYNVRKLKVIFVIYSEFPFPLHSHFLMSEFFKGYVMCDIATDWMQKQIWESSCLLLSQILKKLYEHKITSLTNFCLLWKKYTVLFH